MTTTSATPDMSIPRITLSGTTNQGGLNCLMFSPMQLVSLGLSGAMRGSLDGTGITCKATDRTTGQQSEMSVFSGHSATAAANTISKCGLVKLIKTVTPELNRFGCPQIDGLVVDCQSSDNYTAKVFDNMRMAVATCGSPSRYYNRCYLTGRDFADKDAEQLTGRCFSGAQTIYGERFYLVSLQYSQSLEPIFPIADAYFNLMHKLIPLAFAAPKLISHTPGREYLKCQVRRSNGQIQPAFIKLDRFSMISYKTHKDGMVSLIPYITVYFNANGDDIVDLQLASPCDGNQSAQQQIEMPYEQKFPAHDCFKAIKVTDFLAENPGLTEFFELELGFEQLTLQGLINLMKDEQQ